MAGVTPGMVVGVNTEVIAGEKLIITAGAIDSHGTHFFLLRSTSPPLTSPFSLQSTTFALSFGPKRSPAVPYGAIIPHPAKVLTLIFFSS